jgi:hypothetical protein
MESFVAFSSLLRTQHALLPPLAQLTVIRLLLPLVTIAVAFVAFKAIRSVCEYVRVWYWIAKIPGAPAHPLLGHSVLVMHLDRFKFVHGTYVRK